MTTEHIEHTRKIKTSSNGQTEVIEKTVIKRGILQKPKWLEGVFRPKPKPETVAQIPEESRDAYDVVAASILARLRVDSDNETGAYPLDYGELGGTDTPLNSLNLLNARGLTDENIVKAFMKSSAAKEFKADPDAAARVNSALRAIRAVDLARNKR